MLAVLNLTTSIFSLVAQIIWDQKWELKKARRSFFFSVTVKLQNILSSLERNFLKVNNTSSRTNQLSRYFINMKRWSVSMVQWRNEIQLFLPRFSTDVIWRENPFMTECRHDLNILWKAPKRTNKARLGSIVSLITHSYLYPIYLKLTRALSLTLSLSLSLSLSHTHTHTHSLTHSLSLSVFCLSLPAHSPRLSSIFMASRK